MSLPEPILSLLLGLTILGLWLAILLPLLSRAEALALHCGDPISGTGAHMVPTGGWYVIHLYRPGGRVKSEEWFVRDSAAAPIEFMGFVATLLLGLLVVIVVVHIL